MKRLAAVARLYGAEHVILTVPDGSEETIRRLKRTCDTLGLTVEVANLDIVAADEWLEQRRARPARPQAQAG